ncbi:Ig-like domain-containing protein [Butyrivibrio sp. FC2001]|uniref:Ig-like domain-containing protein n=1 Tax=Butyrivibrio sp. FC2001 TaxID=1280671 RepID=UPI0003F7E228|nr:Ig-like domain-containing protein [Butyrivibrio sp. FC2001]
MKGKQKSMILKRIGSRMKGLAALLMAMALIVGMMPGMEARARSEPEYYLVVAIGGEEGAILGSGNSDVDHLYDTSTSGAIHFEYPILEFRPNRNITLVSKLGQETGSAPVKITAAADTYFYYGTVQTGNIVVIFNGDRKDATTHSNQNFKFPLPAGKYTVRHTQSERTSGGNPLWTFEVNSVGGDEGQIDTETDTEGNVPKPKANMSKEFAMSLLNADEKGLVAEGASVKLTFRITDSNIPAGDKQQIESKLPEYNNAKIGLLFDASLWLQVARNAARKVSNFNKQKLTAEFEVPQSLLPGNGIKRTFMLFNVHDNVAKLLAKTTEKTIVTELDGLSTFAIAYQDEPINSFMSGLKLSWKKDGLGVKWDKTEGASKYEVYATYCGKKFSKKATKKTSSNKVTIKKIKKKDIDLTKNVKVYVKAYDSEGKEIGETITAHFVGKGNPKFTNPKNIKLSTKSITVDKGQSSKIKASVKREDSKKKLLKEAHDAKLRYASSDISVATVDKNGNVTGVEPGNCTVYVYAVSGIAKKVSVTVK